MTVSSPHSEGMREFSLAGAGARADGGILRAVVIATAIFWSVAFIVVGLRYQLQMYGDGALFSYSAAVQDAWNFHWHNISGRSAVYLLTLLPAQVYVGLTGDPNGGVILYGLLFFVAPLLGLLATFKTDGSQGRVIFAFACFSTACLCPLVFGFPTEMWMAHALFWPTLAVAHYGRQDMRGNATLFALLLTLIFTHAGAIILALAIVASVALRGRRDLAFRSVSIALLATILVRVAARVVLPPGAYFADAYVRAALTFFDIGVLGGDLVLLLLGTVACYSLLFLALSRFAPGKAHLYAALIVGFALVTYWLTLDHALHTTNRYYLRTALVVLTPMLGAAAAVYALRADGRLNVSIPIVGRAIEALAVPATARAILGAFLLVMLVHAVETAKFVKAWTNYKAAVASLATGQASDPALGDPEFVSSDRIGADLNHLSWFSTTQFLSVIVAKFSPTRLVVDPTDSYFWFSCETAKANLKANRAVPAATRRLVRIHACLHR